MHDESHYQRLLIPVNIVVMVLCLVAALSIIFAPLIRVDVGQVVKGIVEMPQTEGESGDAGDAEDAAWGDAIFENMKTEESFKGVIWTFTTMDAFRYGSGDGISGLVDALLDRLGTGVEDIILTIAVPQVIQSMFDVNVENAGESVQKVAEKLQALETATTDAEKDQAIAAFLDTVEAEFDVELGEEDRASVTESINTLYEDTKEKNGGKFTVEACICLAASEGISHESGETVECKSYSELVQYMLNSALASAGDGIDMNVISEAISTLFTSFGWSMFFFAAVWLILFLFAFVHIFLSNKRFMMWYVKLFGAYPCLFWLAPTVLGSVISGGAIEDMAAYATILAGISSSMWICGLCYLLLWAVSVFWAFPIKHQIRKMR